MVTPSKRVQPEFVCIEDIDNAVTDVMTHIYFISLEPAKQM